MLALCYGLLYSLGNQANDSSDTIITIQSNSNIQDIAEEIAGIINQVSEVCGCRSFIVHNLSFVIFAAIISH